MFAEIASLDKDVFQWGHSTTASWIGEYMGYVITVQEREGTWVWAISLPIVTTGLAGSAGSAERARRAAANRVLDFHVPYRLRPS